MAWVLLLAAAAAVGLIGLSATVLVFPSGLGAVPARFWTTLIAASLLTLASLSLRALRWIFLLRRADARIPIRDAYVGYFAGFALLLAPLFLGEIALRAWALRRRGGVPVWTTAVLNLWERWLDVLAHVGILGLLAVLTGSPRLAAPCLGLAAAFVLLAPMRRILLAAVVGIVGRVARLGSVPGSAPIRSPEVTRTRTTVTVMATGLVAWSLPILGFWLILGRAGTGVPALDAARLYVSSTLVGGLSLAPGGVVVTGDRLLTGLVTAGVPLRDTALLVLGIRLATTGVTTAFGLVMTAVLVAGRRVPEGEADHFDAIADAYDVQIPESRRQALLSRKTSLMRDWLERHDVGRRGLDLGCGQGWYVARMRALGFDVTGIDTSAGQVALAARHLGQPGLAQVGSALAIPAGDQSLDFVYTINVLHHLPSVSDQRRAFAEVLRVLRPGGVLFLHEINTTNVLFRFYMGYVFPSLNCIDEGVERWLLPRELPAYVSAPVEDVQYFTFFPDFLPEAIVQVLAPVERALERSALRPYSAHYMAVIRKPAP